MPISTNVVVDLAIKAVNICCVVGYCIYTGKITSPVSAAAACKQHILESHRQKWRGLAGENVLTPVHPVPPVPLVPPVQRTVGEQVFGFLGAQSSELL